MPVEYLDREALGGAEVARAVVVVAVRGARDVLRAEAPRANAARSDLAGVPACADGGFVAGNTSVKAMLPAAVPPVEQRPLTSSCAGLQMKKLTTPDGKPSEFEVAVTTAWSVTLAPTATIAPEPTLGVVTVVVFSLPTTTHSVTLASA